MSECVSFRTKTRSILSFILKYELFWGAQSPIGGTISNDDKKRLQIYSPRCCRLFEKTKVKQICIASITFIFITYTQLNTYSWRFVANTQWQTIFFYYNFAVTCVFYVRTRRVLFVMWFDFYIKNQIPFPFSRKFFCTIKRDSLKTFPL